MGSVVSSVATAWCPSLRSAPAQQRRFQRNAPEDHRSHEVTLASSIGYAKESKANAERKSVPQNVETLAAFASGQSVACSRHLPLHVDLLAKHQAACETLEERQVLTPAPV